MSSVAHRLKSTEEGDGWFFGIFQPDHVKDPANDQIFRFEDAPDSLLSQSASCWALKPGEEWHGFNDADIANDYCLLDPTKVTILTPGINANGQLADWGIPAAILTAFLDSRRWRSPAPVTTLFLHCFRLGPAKANGAVC
jgi:arginine decarboxylase